MAKDFNKRNLTTGDIAKLCGVNFRTVIRWIQRGHLKAFQLPGRGDNRVQVADFIAFLQANDMPIPEELQPSGRRVLIVESDEKQAQALEKALSGAGYETRIATDGFAAGAMIGAFSPGVMAVDVSMKGVDGAQAVAMAHSGSAAGPVKVVALAPASLGKRKRQDLEKAGAEAILDRPVKPADLVDAVKSLA